MPAFATRGSYEANVSILLVMEFMISFDGAFMMTSLVKLVGRVLLLPKTSVNSANSLSDGSCPKSSR